MPPEWDTTSSSTTVYHNKNVVVLTLEDNEPQMYEYDVTEYTREEYNAMTIETLRADVAYIGMMTEVL